jgi:hypothetical protein
MNRKDREEICRIIAGWEWHQAASSSEGAAYARCAETLIRTFKPSDADLNFARMWELIKLLGKEDDDTFCDLLFDLCDEKGNTWIVDQVESMALEDFAKMVME